MEKKVELNEVSGERIEVKIGGEFFTSYYFGKEVVRPYLHPLIGPTGKSVVRGYPLEDIPGETKDHPHHKGLWVAHGDVNGVDNWSEEEGHGRVIHKEFLELKEGAESVLIRTRNDWVSKEGEKTLEEERSIEIYNPSGGERTIDLEVLFRASEGEVKFGDTKEGGIVSVRMATSMDGDKGGKIENSEGRAGEKETWGKKAKWCDYSGSVEGKIVGISLFDHPQNLRHPSYWHVRDYGLMTANVFGISYFEDNPEKRGDYVLKSGNELKFQYRIYIHRGDSREGRVKEKYEEYLKERGQR